MSKLRKSAVETRLAASLSAPGQMREDSGFAEHSGFVLGHRFTDAAKLGKLSTIILTLALFSAALALAGESSPNSNNQLPASPAKEKAGSRMPDMSRSPHHRSATPDQACLDQRSR